MDGIARKNGAYCGSSAVKNDSPISSMNTVAVTPSAGWMRWGRGSVALVADATSADRLGGCHSVREWLWCSVPESLPTRGKALYFSDLTRRREGPGRTGGPSWTSGGMTDFFSDGARWGVRCGTLIE